MALVFFLIGLLIMIISIVFAVKNRYNTKKWIGCITTGVFFSTLFLVLPTQWVKDSSNVTVQFLYSFASSLFFSFKALAGRADLAQMESIPFGGWLKTVYVVLNYAEYIAAPVLASTLILSFFGDTMEKLKYIFSFSKRCCIFSELNSNSLTLAQSIKKERGRETIVFCNSKGANEKLIEQARKIGAVLLYRECDTIKPSWHFSRVEYYLMSNSEDENIKYAESIINTENTRIIPLKNPCVVNTFFKTSSKVEVLEDMAATGKLKLRFVDEIALFCSNLVFKHPLYELPNNRKDISIMIVGCGTWGMQMLKTVISAGQIDGYALKIRVYDICAEHIEKTFYHQCPELKTLGIDLKFIKTDIQTEDFFDKAKDCLDATYVCIATGSDDINLEISNDLYRFFRRENGFSDYTPSIFVRVRENIVTKNMESLKSAAEEKKSYLERRKIILFGTTESFFSDGTLFNTWLEKLTLGVHLVYNNVFNADKNSEKYKEKLNKFYSSVYNRRSSMATAMHFGAKILMCCGRVSMDGKGRIVDETLLKKYEKAIADKNNLERLLKNEHKRWNYYMATDGYQSVTIDDVKKYYSEVKYHKDALSKSHPCIIPFEGLSKLDTDLTEVEMQYINEQGFSKHEEFWKYDKMIVEKLPDIIRFANESLNEEK